jgi:NAD(P)-dependent dehydrogenase (short-subunit alcohol dehydrogenase family)
VNEKNGESGEVGMVLSGRVAIVTGAGGGLGRSHALMLAGLGARLLVNDMNAQAAERVAGEISAAGGEAIGFAASVNDEARIAEMVAAAMAAWGRVDILVNNAGILRDRSVVMTTSSSGLYGNFGQANYGAAKMALVGLMQTLSLEGEKHGIKVNCLAPTAATAMTGGLLSQDALERLSPELVSAGLLALVGDDAPTRAILCAGAGHFARSNVTLTQGVHVGGGEGAAGRVVSSWSRISDRTGEIVPEYGFTQMERELASGPAAARPKAVGG